MSRRSAQDILIQLNKAHDRREALIKELDDLLLQAFGTGEDDRRTFVVTHTTDGFGLLFKKERDDCSFVPFSMLGNFNDFLALDRADALDLARINSI